jgi:hypothetical protein
MGSTNKLWLTAPLALGLIVAACGGNDSGSDTATEAPASTAEANAEQATPEAQDDGTASTDTGSSTMVAMLGDEEIAIERALCYFEEQERAGLGGAWTHTSQASGTTADGQPVVIALDRARNEDGTVEDSIHVDIGDPASEDFVGLSANGPEGLVEFGDASVSAQDVEVTDFETDPVSLSISFDC